MYAVIMAGGVGTRFWPMSREAFPKQFLSLFGNRSMIQQTYDRLLPLFPPEKILVISNINYLDIIYEQLPDIPRSNIFGEPIAKNTAPCVALAAKVVNDRDPGSTFAVLPADHLISNNDAFITVLKHAFNTAERNALLVTIGIKPTHPETGYGYIQLNNKQRINDNSWQVKAFTEKPDNKTAKEFIDSGDYLWNSGMFVWKSNIILNEIESNLPQIYQQLYALNKIDFANDEERSSALLSFYSQCEAISVDYGIMERASSVAVIPADMGWNDVGSWLAAYELSDKDKNGNVLESPLLTMVNSSNNYVKTTGKKLIALAGVSDLAIIETDDALLICNLNQSQDVKEVVNQLNEQLARFR